MIQSLEDKEINSPEDQVLRNDGGIMYKTFGKNIADEFIDEEDIIAKVQYLENITEKYQYLPLQYPESFSTRISLSISQFPSEHRRAALALFASIIYLSEPLLNEAWREAVYTLKDMLNLESELDFSDTAFFAVDDPGLITHISHLANLEGREDHDRSPGLDTTTDIINELSLIIFDNDYSKEKYSIEILLSKKNWVLLTDNSISGGSLASDLKKLNRIKNIFFQKDTGEISPNIYAIAQIITSQAIHKISEVIPINNLAFGLLFGDEFRISSERCSLFNKEETLLSVRSLCDWFGDVCFLDQMNPDFRKRIEEHVLRGGRDNYAYGWKDCGYTIVTQNNALSNSVPAIYHQPPSEIITRYSESFDYNPPFPRIESRLSHKTSKDNERLSEIEKWENIKTLRERILE